MSSIIWSASNTRALLTVSNFLGNHHTCSQTQFLFIYTFSTTEHPKQEDNVCPQRVHYVKPQYDWVPLLMLAAWNYNYSQQPNPLWLLPARLAPRSHTWCHILCTGLLDWPGTHSWIRIFVFARVERELGLEMLVCCGQDASPRHWGGRDPLTPSTIAESIMCQLTAQNSHRWWIQCSRPEMGKVKRERLNLWVDFHPQDELEFLILIFLKSEEFELSFFINSSSAKFIPAETKSSRLEKAIG